MLKPLSLIKKQFGTGSVPKISRKALCEAKEI